MDRREREEESGGASREKKAMVDYVDEEGPRKMYKKTVCHLADGFSSSISPV